MARTTGSQLPLTRAVGFFGRELKPIPTQAEAKRVRELKRGGSGGYVTWYEALAALSFWR